MTKMSGPQVADGGNEENAVQPKTSHESTLTTDYSKTCSTLKLQASHLRTRRVVLKDEKSAERSDFRLCLRD